VHEEKLRPDKFLRLKLGDEISHEPLNLVSDADGWIRYTGRTGKYVIFSGLKKDGYIWTAPPNLGTLIYEPGGKRRTTVSLDMEKAFDPKGGYVLHMWRRETTEPVLPISIDVNMDVQENGQWVSNYYVSFVPPRVESRSFEGADLVIHGLRRPTGVESRRYEFTFELSVPEGGILLSEAPYPFQAPTSGYQPSWSFDNKPQNNPPDFPWVRTMYFILRGGKAYAGLRVGFCDQGFNLSYNGYMNPYGSTRLEPDPEKLITDPEEIRRIDEQTRPK
jgi:hypothetical protein